MGKNVKHTHVSMDWQTKALDLFQGNASAQDVQKQTATFPVEKKLGKTKTTQDIKYREATITRTMNDLNLHVLSNTEFTHLACLICSWKKRGTKSGEV